MRKKPESLTHSAHPEPAEGSPRSGGEPTGVPLAGAAEEYGSGRTESKSARTGITLRVRAMRHLARREHSRAELRAKLLPHVEAGEDVDAVLDELEKRNWLSDARAAQQMVNSKRPRFGAQRITHELRQRGIAENLISSALPHLKETELETATAVWQKKFGTVPQDAKEKAKQARFLQSRGFSMDVVFKVLRFEE